MGSIIKNLILATFILMAMNTQSLAKEYLYAISGDYPPYEYSENNEAKGLFAEIMRESFQRMGIEVLPTDVNVSGLNFTVVKEEGEKKIRYGLIAVKGVGEAPVTEILRAREKHERFRTKYFSE